MSAVATNNTSLPLNNTSAGRKRVTFVSQADDNATAADEEEVADSHATSHDNDIAAKLRAIMNGDDVDIGVDEHDELDQFQQIERELSIRNDDDDDNVDERCNGDHDENDNDNDDYDDDGDNSGSKYDAKYDDGNAVESAKVDGTDDRNRRRERERDLELLMISSNVERMQQKPLSNHVINQQNINETPITDISNHYSYSTIDDAHRQQQRQHIRSNKQHNQSHERTNESDHEYRNEPSSSSPLYEAVDPAKKQQVVDNDDDDPSIIHSPLVQQYFRDIRKQNLTNYSQPISHPRTFVSTVKGVTSRAAPPKTVKSFAQSKSNKNKTQSTRHANNKHTTTTASKQPASTSSSASTTTSSAVSTASTASSSSSAIAEIQALHEQLTIQITHYQTETNRLRQTRLECERELLISKTENKNQKLKLQRDREEMIQWMNDCRHKMKTERMELEKQRRYQPNTPFTSDRHERDRYEADRLQWTHERTELLAQVERWKSQCEALRRELKEYRQKEDRWKEDARIQEIKRVQSQWNQPSAQSSLSNKSETNNMSSRSSSIDGSIYANSTNNISADESRRPHSPSRNVPLVERMEPIKRQTFMANTVTTAAPQHMHQPLSASRASVPPASSTTSSSNDIGKIESRLADGSRLIRFHNGTIKHLAPNGEIRIQFTNGDWKWTAATSQQAPSNAALAASPVLSSGILLLSVYYYAIGDVYHSSYSDGVQQYEFTGVQRELHTIDGHKLICNEQDQTYKHVTAGSFHHHHNENTNQDNDHDHQQQDNEQEEEVMDCTSGEIRLFDVYKAVANTQLAQIRL